MDETWGTTETGMVFHSFGPDRAICRKNIKRPENGSFRTEAAVVAALDKPWGIRTQGFRKCDNCTRLEAEAAERAEASMEPSTGEGDYLPPAETTPTPNKETPMGNSHRPTSGPFTPVQRSVLMGLVQGKTQREIAAETGVRESYVSAELAIARQKTSCSTTAHAVSTMATALAYLEAADLLEEDAGRYHEGHDHHCVAHVLAGLAKILRDRAAALLPK